MHGGLNVTGLFISSGRALMSDCNSGGGHSEEPHGVLDDVAPLSPLGPLEQAVQSHRMGFFKSFLVGVTLDPVLLGGKGSKLQRLAGIHQTFIQSSKCHPTVPLPPYLYLHWGFITSLAKGRKSS